MENSISELLNQTTDKGKGPAISQDDYRQKVLGNLKFKPMSDLETPTIERLYFGKNNLPKVKTLSASHRTKYRKSAMETDIPITKNFDDETFEKKIAP
ncbi:hypothetical protein RND71_030804 [Anisodus tanguticus]|uniref:Uncharacterized protein n=1 Tax=Anisodus tanguticus TaxID=243964 RepID=A0AAE1V5U3_9SOLA|nr:hypothetical protein RND71_030804 [Anisodus tanguticus]